MSAVFDFNPQDHLGPALVSVADVRMHLDRALAACQALGELCTTAILARDGLMSRECSLPTDHQPIRGSNVEAWIRQHRETFRSFQGGPTSSWYALDYLLNEYREHADTGTPLGREVQGPHPEEG